MSVETRLFLVEKNEKSIFIWVDNSMPYYIFYYLSVFLRGERLSKLFLLTKFLVSRMFKSTPISSDFN